MASPADKIALDLISGQVDLLRYSEDIRLRVMAQLQTLQQDLISKIARVDLGQGQGTEAQLARLETILESVDTAIETTYKGIASTVAADTLAMLRVQQNAVLGIVNGALGSKLMTHTLTATQMRSIVSDTLIQGAPSADWWSRQVESVQQAFADQMRQGMLAGEGLGQLVQRIRGSRDGVIPGVQGIQGVNEGVMDRARQNAEALVRTSVITTANQSKLDLYAENSDVIAGVMWVSTLDLRTTKICQGLNGKVWEVGTWKPIGHEEQFPGPTAHWNCRSTQIPVTRSWEEMATKNKALARKLDKMPASTRASMDGQVPDRMTFNDFLNRKNQEDPTAVEEFLGKRAYKAWSEEGTVEAIGRVRSLSDLGVQRGNPLNLSELRKKSGYDMSSPAELRATRDSLDKQLADIKAGLLRLEQQRWQMEDRIESIKERKKDLEALLKKKQGKK